MELTALVVAAHPDDAELGMGGTIAQLLSTGVRVVVVDLTDGEPTPYGSPEIRAKETAAASAILGIKDRRHLGLKNREVFDTVDNRKLLAGVIRDVQPSLLFLPYWEDAHPDHVQTCALGEAARFYSKFVKSDLPGAPTYPRKVLHYIFTHHRPRIAPSLVFNVTDQIDRKMDAVRAYASQFVQHPSNAAKLDAIRRDALFWGDQVGVVAAEPFMCRETIRISDPATLFAI